MSEFNKVFIPSNNSSGIASSPCVQVFTNNYNRSLEHVKKLVAEMKHDFPKLKDNQINVQLFGGNRNRGIMFVEAFLEPSAKMPEGYTEINKIEYIL